MKTWNEYKQHAKDTSSISKQDITEMEELANIISILIAQRNELGLSQRDLASMCGIPQSSVARIESCRTTPNLATLLKLLRPLGLKLTISK